MRWQRKGNGRRTARGTNRPRVAAVGLGTERLEPRQLMAGDLDMPAADPAARFSMMQFVRELQSNDGTGPTSKAPWLDFHSRDPIVPSISAIPGPPQPPPVPRPRPDFVITVEAPPIDPPVEQIPTITTDSRPFTPVPLPATSDGPPRPLGQIVISGTRRLPVHQPDTAPAEQFDESWTREDNDAARFAELVYWWEGRGFQQLGIKYRPTDGLQASLFQAEDGTYYLAFRGTEFYSLDDWETNLAQHLGLQTSQYEQAYLLAMKVGYRLSATEGRLVLTGHSLGGSLATYAAERLGGTAIVFNPSSVHPFVPNNPQASVRSHIVVGDPLSVGRHVRNRFSLIHRAPRGDVLIRLPSEINTHSMGNFP